MLIRKSEELKNIGFIQFIHLTVIWLRLNLSQDTTKKNGLSPSLYFLHDYQMKEKIAIITSFERKCRWWNDAHLPQCSDVWDDTANISAQIVNT